MKEATYNSQSQNLLTRLYSRFFHRTSITVGRNGCSVNGDCSELKDKGEQKLEIEIHDANAEKPEKLICLFDESPYYILKVAAQGNLEEVIRLILEDKTRLAIRDYRGQNIVHHAVTWSRIHVLDYLETLGIPSPVDINAQDKVGNSPIHHAIDKNQPGAVAWLLAHDADMNVKNNQNQAPIHFAVELLRLEMVQMIIKKHPWTVNQPGDQGATPLHYAATKDSPPIAKLLLEEGADLLKNCDTGCPPIHSATRHGSANVIDVLLEFAEKRGMSGKSLIHLPDKEDNLPLHAATNSGDIKAVRVCLKAGADIDAQQANDRQTAVHYAAAQGGFEMIKLMFETQPDKRETCIHCRDILEQTPLHKAAMLNHVQVVEQLINEGASINAQDGERRTPLLLAAAKNASRVVNALLKRRANTNLRDKDNRNFLHLIILNGSKLKDIDLGSIKNLKQLMNERDDFGCTPIHYASKTGQLTTLRGLLQLGAAVTLKDNDKKNALHFAAKYGRYETCRNLLASEHGALLINEVDGDGRTPLHIAASRGNYKVIALLVRNGALMNKDFQQNTPLHLAAEFGHHEAVVLLVGLAPHLLNAGNKTLNTALHLAAMNGHALVVDYLMSANATFEANSDGATFFDVAIGKFQSEATAAIINHPRCEEAMQLPSTFTTPFIGLIQHLPKMALLFLDKCLTYSADNKKNKNFCIRYDFRYLQASANGKDQQSPAEDMPLLPMNMMVKYNRVDCLTHPVCVTFLKQKWNSFGSLVYNLRVVIYILFLGLLTSVCLDIDASIEVHNPKPAVRLNAEHGDDDEVYLAPTTSRYVDGDTDLSSSSNYSRWDNSTGMTLSVKAMSRDLSLRMLLVVAFCVINVIVQFIAIFQQKLTYFLDLTHYLECTLYITTFLAILPSYGGDVISVREQLMCAAISLLLGWITLLLYMQGFDFFGMYVVMFLQVAKTLIRALVVFSFIIIAFALSFNMVFRTTHGQTQEFVNPIISLMTTLSMMVGEANYVHIITPTLDGRRQLIYGDLTYIFFIAFIMLIPTLLMNLLVGLAVGDIETVQKNAQLKRLAMQVEYFTLLERKMPKVFLLRRTLTEYKFFPNRSKFAIFQSIKTCLHDTYQTEVFHIGQDFDSELDNGKNDFAYLLEELTHQSKQMVTLATKLETQQDLLKAIMQRMDNEYGNENDEDEDVMDESGEGCDDISVTGEQQHGGQHGGGGGRKRLNSNEFHSSGARTHWQVVAARLAASKKPKTSQIWFSTSDDKDPKGSFRATSQSSSSRPQSGGSPHEPITE